MIEEPETNLTWTYEPNQNVNISLDITSFTGTGARSADPFGTEFEIYIDAPMLDIVDDMGGKLKKDVSKTGRFIYTVDADRDIERTFGTGEALYKDNVAGVNQSGERKTLKFKTNTVTSVGEIKISSNKDKVVYYDQIFNVKNELITGTIHYTNDGATMIPVPKDAFVSFALKRNGVRIGSITMVADGQYTLNLRKEYTFGWISDPIELNYITPDGLVYDNVGVHATENISLSDIFSNGAIVLTPPNM